MIETSPIYRSRFYSDCLGVFQGGGCRAAAFAGAYAAAFELGVRLSEVAGTSAGSIVAGLIAAGAGPGFILERVMALDFSTLLRTPSRSLFGSAPRLARVLSHLPLGNRALRTVAAAADLGGLYSSIALEDWIEGCLRELIGKPSSRVEFRDLAMPLHVVAGDLSAMKARVWSSHATPRQSVAHAIRASCSIPIFFQPVEEGSALLVDGGLISNLPHFVFAGSSSARDQLGKRLLLFALEATEESSRASDLEELVLQLASLVVDGGTDVQLSFAPDVARIVIPTGSIRATDFKEMDASKVQMLGGCPSNLAARAKER